MKKVVLILSLILLLIYANNKSFGQGEFDNPSSVINFLVGEWNWISSCGRYAGFCTNHDTVDYTMSYTFVKIANSEDSILYAFYRNDTILLAEDCNDCYVSTFTRESSLRVFDKNLIDYFN